MTASTIPAVSPEVVEKMNLEKNQVCHLNGRFAGISVVRSTKMYLRGEKTAPQRLSMSD